ncbi:helix-turn-helix domain-containing protein [Streptomyces virginiae]|uniref:helix-turn-helix domain-containing protein n=1 Tax=Streptomyces virginiae TaxID=1961 RepID=UPI00369AA524
MHDEHDTLDPALTELRERLRGGMARMRLNQTDLAKRAGLGRTTVSEALSPAKPAPSPETVAALARALRLPVEELLELQRSAVEDTGSGVRSAPGRSIGEWDPHDLEVHPAGPGGVASGPGRSGIRTMPAYVRREHDRVLADLVEDAAAGRSRAVVLVGGSSTGKTRACWEAVQPLAEEGWRLWHPFDPTRAQDALEDLPLVAPRTVVWLNEAQHYLGDPTMGERIAAAVHRLLMTVERGPVLVLGTLWPDYATQYTALPARGGGDAHSRVRELLAGRTLSVPESFDAPALAAAAALAEDGDRLLADALSRAGAEGRITQDLAGAPELLNRYRHATPAAAAVLEAAMDARRLGVGLHLPQTFLTDAAADYLTDTDYDQLTDDWSQRAFTELAEPVHGKQAPLRSTTPRPRRRPPTPSPPAQSPHLAGAGPMLRLADYLEQHGRAARRALCPPDSFWHAALTHLTHPDDLSNLTEAAQTRHRLQWAHHLRHRAADHGNPDALVGLAELRENAGDWKGVQNLYQQAADRGDTRALVRLVELLEEAGDREGVKNLYQQAADRGDTYALARLVELLEEAGDREGAENLARQVADRGDTVALVGLAELREEAGNRESAENLYRQAADRGDTDALDRLVELLEEAGNRESAESLARQAADRGDTEALHCLAELREEAGDRESAENLYQQAADRGDIQALDRLAKSLEEAGDRENAESIARQVANRGNIVTLVGLAVLRKNAGDRESAENLYRQAADRGHPYALACLAELREEAGDRESAENLYRQAGDRGYIHALVRLVELLEKAADREGAESIARQAADSGRTGALASLAELREKAGDWESAENLYRQAADFGTEQYDLMRQVLAAWWPNGLDPDGTPTPPWQ